MLRSERYPIWAFPFEFRLHKNPTPPPVPEDRSPGDLIPPPVWEMAASFALLGMVLKDVSDLMTFKPWEGA